MVSGKGEFAQKIDPGKACLFENGVPGFGCGGKEVGAVKKIGQSG